MNTMAPPRPTELDACRVRLTAGPAAAAQARRQVRAAICAWDIPVDPDVAILLTSELVTNAIRHEVTGIVMLAITCSAGQLRVDVHDTSRALPTLIDAPADAEKAGASLRSATSHPYVGQTYDQGPLQALILTAWGRVGIIRPAYHATPAVLHFNSSLACRL